MWDACGLFTPLKGDDESSEWMKYVSQRSARALDTNNNSNGSGDAPDQRMSPFLKYQQQDDYHFPDLYSEIDEMMECCALIYPLVELRRKARQNTVFDPETSQRLLELPISHLELYKIVKDNQFALLDTKFAKEFYLQTLKVLSERTVWSPTRIIACDDQYEMLELVYSVEVNAARKRVTVCFRGSVTQLDWATNYEIYMKAVPNPNASHQSQQATIKLHHGFYDYLLTANRRGVTRDNGKVLNEYDEIMQLHVLPVLKAHPGYKLYVTGHSLGAALATVFGFYAASEKDSDVPKPVSVFSVGGPYVGDASFRSSHQLLESHGKLRHLRVSNHRDIVTLVPKMSWRFNLLALAESHVGTLFKHVGINVRLYEGADSMEITYPRVRTGTYQAAWDEIGRGWDQSIISNLSWNPFDYISWPWHSIREYNDRLENNQPVLRTMTLNELYSRKDIVGNLVAEF